MGDSSNNDLEVSKNGFVVKITNIPNQIDESSLKSVMSHFGKVEFSRILFGENPTDPATAWVVYKQKLEREAAVKADGKIECGGCRLKMIKWDGDVPSESYQSKRKLTESSTCQDSCWFCLSNKECEIHMISYVSKHCYVAMAKGALSDMHTLVVPIYHYPNLGSAPFDVQMDIKNVIDSLFEVALQKGMGAIAFERFVPMNMKVTMHTQIQVLAVPLDKALKSFDFIDKSEVFNDSIRIAFESEDVGFNGLSSKVDTNTQYLYLQAVGKSLESDDKVSYAKCLWVLKRQRSVKIPTHFGREMALSVLSHKDLDKINSLKKYVNETNMSPELAAVDWHNCVATKEEETNWSKNITKLLLDLK